MSHAKVEGAPMPSIERILVPMDFGPCSDEALGHALRVAYEHDAEVVLLHVWSPHDPTIFADTPQGLAMEERLSAAAKHAQRVSGRLEFGPAVADVILDILGREHFDLVVMGAKGLMSPADARGHIAASVADAAPCDVVMLPPSKPAL
jgi:nucleotide-binding universal stress UspA family protein